MSDWVDSKVKDWSEFRFELLVASDTVVVGVGSEKKGLDLLVVVCWVDSEMTVVSVVLSVLGVDEQFNLSLLIVHAIQSR